VTALTAHIGSNSVLEPAGPPAAHGGQSTRSADALSSSVTARSLAASLDILRIHRRLRVYTVVFCKSFTAQCAELTAYTEGLVADMAGTSVVGVLRDDAPDEETTVAEATIYPESLRAEALGYMNSGGPSSLHNRAAQIGCPHWTGS
jgi:hypothetical protein